MALKKKEKENSGFLNVKKKEKKYCVFLFSLFPIYKFSVVFRNVESRGTWESGVFENGEQHVTRPAWRFDWSD